MKPSSSGRNSRRAGRQKKMAKRKDRVICSCSFATFRTNFRKSDEMNDGGGKKNEGGEKGKTHKND